MSKLFDRGFMIAAMFFVAVTFTGAYLSDSVSVSGNTFATGVSSHTDIVLNEVMVNPAVEDGSNPDGEWVELYNKGSWTIDVSGWEIYDDGSHHFAISVSNTNTGGTIISAGGYLAVYRNGSAIFNNDSPGDSVRLFDGPIATGILIDSMTYPSSTDSKTWDRIPNGVGTWSDGHTLTIGGPNV